LAQLAPHFGRLGSALFGSLVMLAELTRLFANPGIASYTSNPKADIVANLSDNVIVPENIFAKSI
jgi:hypothetical protein